MSGNTRLYVMVGVGSFVGAAIGGVLGVLLYRGLS